MASTPVLVWGGGSYEGRRDYKYRSGVSLQDPEELWPLWFLSGRGRRSQRREGAILSVGKDGVRREERRASKGGGRLGLGAGL